MDDDAIQTIRERAYAIWEEEGRPSGRDERHWLQAIAEVTAKQAYGLEPTTLGKMRRRAKQQGSTPLRRPEEQGSQ